MNENEIQYIDKEFIEEVIENIDIELDYIKKISNNYEDNTNIEYRCEAKGIYE